MRTAGLVRCLAAVAVAVSATACSDAETPRGDVTVQELTGDASGEFDLDDTGVGERVSLRATVVDVLSDRAFTIGREDTAGGPLLVLTRGQVVTPGDVVQLAGVLRRFGDVDAVTDFGLSADQAQQAATRFETVLVTDVVDDDLPEDGD